MRLIQPLAAVALAGLAGCTTLGLGPEATLRAIDYLAEDLADSIVAVDLPQSLAPVGGTTTVSFEVVMPGSGARRLHLVMVPADASDVA